jgi:DNA-binding FrmR family transcriptional regulator
MKHDHTKELNLLKKANLAILKQHLNTCVKESIETSNFQEKTEEIIAILDKYMK